MSFTIKDVAKNVDISEQGLYKRIKSNYDEYIQKINNLKSHVDNIINNRLL